MVAMKALKAATGKAMTATIIYQSVAESTGLKTKDVKGTVEAMMGVAADQLKMFGSLNIARALKLKLKQKPATLAREGGVNQFTKDPCAFKDKPTSETVRALPMESLKEMVN